METVEGGVLEIQIKLLFFMQSVQGHYPVRCFREEFDSSSISLFLSKSSIASFLLGFLCIGCLYYTIGLPIDVVLLP